MSWCRIWNTAGTFCLRAVPLLAILAVPASAQLTQDEALALAFPDASEVERVTAYLDDAQLERARTLAGPGVEVPSGIVTYYVARGPSGAEGVAYFDAHRVRTLPEVLMVVVTPEATVRQVETVSFGEPPEYRAPEGWLALMEDQGLSEELSLKGTLPNLTGATLTAQAAAAAVRRVLALHTVIAPLASPGTSGAIAGTGGIYPGGPSGAGGRP
jgi:hypothetical protein